MCHIVGVTPEARSLEDARGNKPLRGEFTITQEDYEESRRQICSAGEGKINFVLMGCPHYSLEDIQQVANYIEGKKVAEGVELHVWTDMSTLAMAKASGFVKTIEEAGGNVLSSSCAMVMDPAAFAHVTAMVTDSGKQGHICTPALEQASMSRSIMAISINVLTPLQQAIGKEKHNGKYDDQRTRSL